MTAESGVYPAQIFPVLRTIPYNGYDQSDCGEGAILGSKEGGA